MAFPFEQSIGTSEIVEPGFLPVNRVTAAKAGAKNPRRSDRRVEKTVHIEDKSVTLANGATRTVRLYASGGALGIAELDDTGTQQFVPITRIRTHRNRDKNGRYRWYNDYRLPATYEHQTITVRLHGNDEDSARKLNRTENLRPIPPGDPDFERLFPRRNDAESINRHLEDTMWTCAQHRARTAAAQPPRLRPDRELARALPPPRTRSPTTRRLNAPAQRQAAASTRPHPGRPVRALLALTISEPSSRTLLS